MGEDEARPADLNRKVRMGDTFRFSPIVDEDLVPSKRIVSRDFSVDMPQYGGRNPRRPVEKPALGAPSNNDNVKDTKPARGEKPAPRKTRPSGGKNGLPTIKDVYGYEADAGGEIDDPYKRAIRYLNRDSEKKKADEAKKAKKTEEADSRKAASAKYEELMAPIRARHKAAKNRRKVGATENPNAGD